MRRTAMRQWMEGLSNGDPFAYGLMGVVVLLAVVVGVIYLIDHLNNEKAKGKAGKPRR